MNFLLSFITFGIIFAIVDAAWLTVSRKLYVKEIGSLMRKKPDLFVAVLFYVIYVTGVSVLAIRPVLAVSGGWTDVLLLAGVLGFVAYSTYDLTNQATLKGWSKKIVVIDMIWGTTATAVCAALSYIVLTKLFGL